MQLSVTETSPQEWQYISEGKYSIVLCYVGKSHPQFSGTVLRLKKTGPGIDVELEDMTVAFQRSVIERLIPSEYLPRLSTVEVEKSWLENVAVLCDEMRPLKRRQSSQIDASVERAILATDLVGGATVSVEIKPKWAFLPSPVHLSPATRLMKTRTCRYCMHSYLKWTRGETVPREYCPLDLFSGDRTRVEHAVGALWHDWIETKGSTNNLKIFSHGKIVEPKDVDILGRSLSQISGQAITDIGKGFSIAVVQILMDTPVLRIISKLQRTLDPLDIEGLSQLGHRIKQEDRKEPNDCPSGSTFPLGSDVLDGSPREPSISDWESLVDTYLSSHDRLNHSVPVTDNWRYYSLAYLLSATLKDCSIILRLDHKVDDHRPGNNAVTVIDLGPKSVNRLEKWEKQDKEITLNYTGVDGRQCIDLYSIM